MLEEKFSVDFLCNFNDLIKLEDLPLPWLRKLWSCQWLEILKADWIALTFREASGSEITQSLKDVEDEELLSVFIAFLLQFVQVNFTGPLNSEEALKEFVTSTFPNDFNALQRLYINGEEVNANVQFPELLLAAKLLLQQLLDRNPRSMLLKWWKLRLICVHQKVLDELTSDLYMELTTLAMDLLANANQLPSTDLKALLSIEIAHGFLLFHRVQKSESVLNDLCFELGVDLKVEGLLGVRTKFQQKPLPQLCLKVEEKEKHDFPSANSSNGRTELPKLLKLDDDVRLEKIKFVAEEDNEVLTIPSILQALVLAKVKLLLRSQPKDRLADEELEPYITTLLHQDDGPLPVRLATLLLNIGQESNHKRTVERSLKQCEEVLGFIRGDKFTVFDRLSYVFASSLISSWEVRKQLGDLMVSLGMIKTALDLYLEIQEWEDVIECYTRLELRHKAAEIIRQELEKQPTVKLYCLLGDATDDISCYETAWKFSKETSGRAQRHWGNYYFAKKEYENAIPHLQKSVEINSLQLTQWLRLGYAAIMLEKWELAVQAYIRYTHLEPSGFESWNNLAKALIKLGDKKRAHKILGESLKCNYNNWKVWENFMVVSVDTGNFEDVINAYNRLVEMKERFIDLEVIEIVVKAIAQDTPDAQGRSTKRLTKKTNTLLGHQCVQHASEHKLWELAALIAESPLSRAQKLQKAHRAFTQKETSWATRQDSSLKVLNICRDLCLASLEAVEKHDESENSSVTSQLSSARLSAQACIRTVEGNMEKWDENQEVLAELKLLLEKTTEEMKKRM